MGKKKRMQRKVKQPRVRKNKRNRTLQRAVKQQLFDTFGCICMVCQKEKERQELQLHHIVKHEHSGTTTFEDSSLVCDPCHKVINNSERNNKAKYEAINNQLYAYKASYLANR